MWRRAYNLVSNVASLLLCGLLAGVVVAAVAFPVAAVGGLAAKAGADTFDGLPTDVEVLPSPQITYIYASDGQTVLALLYDENRQDVPISEVAEVMQKAMVASEDSRFYEHNGVDLRGMTRAALTNLGDRDDGLELRHVLGGDRRRAARPPGARAGRAAPHLG